MASVPHSVEREGARVKREGARVPPIVLPFTSRALTDRTCWAILAAAMAVAAALILYLGRGTIYFFDELDFLYETSGLGIGDVLDPHNGHLIATTRLTYKAVLETLGADYVAFRILGVATVLLCAGLFYALVKRRIGALPALAPTVVLLFLGSAWQHVAVPIGFTPLLAIAAGLGSLLSLERGDRSGDVAACLLLVFSVATYTSGLPFVVGAAISVLLRPDRSRRAWIFLVPLVLYAGWWVWSQSETSSSQEGTKLSNSLLFGVWSAESLASVLASLTGLSFDFLAPDRSGIDPAWGRPVAVIAVIALVLRIRKGDVPVALWAALGIVLTWWGLGTLSFIDDQRTPDSVRYLYLGSVGVLLAAATAAASVRFSRLGLGILFAACAVSLATNISLLREGAQYFRVLSTSTQAEFAMIELARDQIDPTFTARDALGVESPTAFVNEPASVHLAAVDRYGSLAMPLSELERESEAVRAYADRVLAAALELRLEPGAAPVDTRRCKRARGPGRARTVDVQLPRRGATLRTRGVGAAPVTVGRFADRPTAEVGSVQSGQVTPLRIPPDASPKPWRASLSGAGSVTVCPLR